MAGQDILAERDLPRHHLQVLLGILMGTDGHVDPSQPGRRRLRLSLAGPSSHRSGLSVATFARIARRGLSFSPLTGRRILYLQHQPILHCVQRNAQYREPPR